MGTLVCSLVSRSSRGCRRRAEEEQEDVQDVEEDARRDRHRVLLARAAEAVEVEDRVAAEDHEAGDRPDHVLAGDRDEDRDEPEHDQRQQRPEEDAVPRGQVAASGVAGRAEGGDERARGTGGLPQRRRIGLGVRAQDGTERQPQQQPEAEEERHRELLASAGGGDVEAEDAARIRPRRRGCPSPPLRSRPM